jgi:voltage-gated potassium channel
VTKHPLAELPRDERRRLLIRSGLRVVSTTVAFIVLYAATPIIGDSRLGAVLGLIAGLLVFLAVIVYQIRQILEADHPALRAAEAVAVAVPLLLVVFAYTYLSMSRNNPSTFNVRLDHVEAMYFTITTLATVGFGDIVATTDGARIAVSIQMLLDFIVLVAALRAVVFAARLGISRKQGQRLPPDPTDPL